MDHDVELLRALLFELEARETSPRSVVIVSTSDEAQVLDCGADKIEGALQNLLELDYIDGPGVDEPGFFLFRKLTRKGRTFVTQARRPRDWQRMKAHYDRMRLGNGA